jgi:hypothetical protein
MIMQILNAQVDAGKLDKEVVMCVDQNLQDCWKVAIFDRPIVLKNIIDG